MAGPTDVALQFNPWTQHTTQAGYWVNRTTSGIVLAKPGSMIGFYVNSTNVGTIQLFDNPGAAANPIGGVITPTIGFQWYPAILLTGLFVTIAGTALDVTFFVPTK